MLSMSKERSTIIKGIVILMMLFLHLFNGNNTDACQNLLYVGDMPLALWLTGACGPVGFFLLLSGYGLAYTYEKGGLGFAKQARRILRLYIHLWVILFVFLIIGHFMESNVYPGSLSKLIINATGWKTTYNAELWFLFPYAVVSLLSKYVIKVVDWLGNIKALLFAMMVHVITSFLISRYGTSFFYHQMLFYQPLLFFHFLYHFVTGVVLFRTKLNLQLDWATWQKLAAILVLVIIACIVRTSAYYIVYVPLMVVLFNSLPYPRWLERILLELGCKSMPMWMIHTWLCYYLFRNYLYALRYPSLIFLALVILSYAIAVPVMNLSRKIIKRCGI